MPGNLAWNLLGTLPENLFLKTFLLVTSSCLGTSCWEPLLGNLFLVSLPGNFAWELCWEPLPGNLAWEPCLGTCSWEPCLGTSCWEPLLGNLFLGTSWEPYLGSFPGNIALEPLPGNVAWEPLPANPVSNLALCGFGCSEGLSWKRKPFLGTRFPTLRRADLAAPACSGTFTMAEDPKLPLLGKNIRFKHIGKVAEVSEDAGISWDLRRDFHVKIFTKMCQAAGAAHRPTARMQNPGGRRSPQSEGQ